VECYALHTKFLTGSVGAVDNRNAGLRRGDDDAASQDGGERGFSR